MAKTSPAQFIAQVRQETAKVVWPTRKETFVTTVFVFILSALAMLFFFLVDLGLQQAVQLLLSIGGA